MDNPEKLKKICESLSRISEKMKLVFPIHPRTEKNLEQNAFMSVLTNSKNIILLEPLRYIHFMNMVFNSRIVITDSGGIQEETTYLGIPCLTLRSNTERPVTISEGTNRLCKVNNFEEDALFALSDSNESAPAIHLWDGKTAGRVVNSIGGFLGILR